MELFAQACSDAILLAGLYALMAVGLSLSFGIIRIINFAHGEMMMLRFVRSLLAFHVSGNGPADLSAARDCCRLHTRVANVSGLRGQGTGRAAYQPDSV